MVIELYNYSVLTELHLQENENWTSRPQGKIILNSDTYDHLL